jgi:hypothetical protein
MKKGRRNRCAGPYLLRAADCPLLVFIRGVLHFLAAALDVLAEAMHRVAGCQSERKQHKGNCGNGFFHDFPFRLNK